MAESYSDHSDLNLLSEKVCDLHNEIIALASTEPEDVASTTDDLLNYVANLKNKRNEYIKFSQELSKALFDQENLSDSKAVRKQRHLANHEVSEFIKFTNEVLKQHEIDVISNIGTYSDVSSVASRGKAINTDSSKDHFYTPRVTRSMKARMEGRDCGTISAEKDALSTKMPSVHFEDNVRPEDSISNQGGNQSKTGSVIICDPPPSTTHQSNPVVSTMGQSVPPPNPVVPSSTNIQFPFSLPGLTPSTCQPNTNNNTPPVYSLSGHMSKMTMSTANLNTSVGQNPIPNTSANLNPSGNPTSYHVGTRTTSVTNNAPIPGVMTTVSHIVPPGPPPGFPPNPTVSLQTSQNQGHIAPPPLYPMASQGQYYQYPYATAATSHQTTGGPFYHPHPSFTNMTPPPPIYVCPPKLSMPKNSIQKFDGTAYHFWSWVEQIRSLLNSYPSPVEPVTVLGVLQANCINAPYETIKNFLSAAGHPTQDLVSEVWNLLIERYGSPDMVAEQIMTKLKKPLTITERASGEKLRELHDLCSIAKFNQNNCMDLATLNSRSGLKFLVDKLPSKLQGEWLDRQYDWKKNHPMRDHPPFSEFVSFLRDSSIKYAHGGLGSEETGDRGKQKRCMATQKVDTSNMATGDITCPLHNSTQHDLLDCKTFGNLSNDLKRKKLYSWKRCTRCLGQHMRNQCEVDDLKCSVCSYNHHTVFHIKNFKPRNANNDHSNKNVTVSNSQIAGTADNVQESEQVSSLCTQVCNNGIGKSCSKTVPIYLTSDDSSVILKTYAIVDDQSNCTLVDPKVPKMLGCKAYECDYSINTVAGCGTTTAGHVVMGLKAKGVFKSKWLPLPKSYTSASIPNAIDEVATRDIVSLHKNLKKYANNFIDKIQSSDEVLILVGRDCAAAMPCRSYGTQEPWLFDTPLGFALVGNACISSSTCSTSQKRVLKTGISHEHFNVEKLFNKKSDLDVFKELADDEELGLSLNDYKFIDIMSNCTQVTSSGHIEAPMPLSNDSPLPDNEAAVYCRSVNMLKRLKTKPQPLEACLASMGKSISEGFIEEVPAGELSGPEGRRWFLPIFPVHQPRKNKVRIVYDASAKFKGTSLNDNLLSGPNLNNDLRGVLQRFREEKVAFVADIMSMFNNFHIAPEFRDLLRFFWFKNNDSNNDIVQFRAVGHVFGCASSPGVAAYCLKFATHLPYAQSYEKGGQYIRSSMYIDDGLSSAATPEEAVQTLQEATKILRNCNIRLHKFMSNSREVLAALPPSEIAEGCHFIDNSADPIPSQRALGVYWDPESDTFKFQVSIPNKPFTKRGILATINSLWDPIGAISPVTLAAKLIQRQILPKKEDMTPELTECGWDDELPNKYRQRWEEWKSTLTELVSIELPRCFIPKDFVDAERELYVFLDASQDGIGYCIYLKSSCEGKFHVVFVAGGSKVAPRTAITVPRLELNAGVEAVLAANKLLMDLRLKPSKVMYYTDSMILLGYINNSQKSFKRYVSRRINIIHKLTKPQQWGYVNTSDNPSDIASRSSNVKELLSSNWFKGPSFLWGPDSPELPSESKAPSELPEEVSEVQVLVNQVFEPNNSSPAYKLSKEISSFNKVVNAMKIIMKFRYYLDITRQRLGISVLLPR